MFVYVGDDILDFIDTINLETGEVKYKGPNEGHTACLSFLSSHGFICTSLFTS